MDACVRHDREGEEIYRSPGLYTNESIRNSNACRRSLRWSDSATVAVDHWPLNERFGPTEHWHEVDVRTL